TLLTLRKLKVVPEPRPADAVASRAESGDPDAPPGAPRRGPAQAGRAEPVDVRDQVLNIPNALSALRLALVPVFFWLVLTHHDGWALAVLAVSGFTDYLDGNLARRWSQVSRVGQLLDP